MTENAAAAGMPKSRTFAFDTRRAIAKMIGSIMMRPASKNIGKPRTSEAMPSAKGARFSPKTSTNLSASDFAPPECSIRRPSIAPRATSRATPASVPPKPSVRVFAIAETGTCATNAVSSETMISVRKAWTLQTMIRNRMRAIAPTAMSSSGPAPRVWVQSSIGISVDVGKRTTGGRAPRIVPR